MSFNSVSIWKGPSVEKLYEMSKSSVTQIYMDNPIQRLLLPYHLKIKQTICEKIKKSERRGIYLTNLHQLVISNGPNSHFNVSDFPQRLISLY